MTWKIFADYYSTNSELSNAEKSGKIKFNKNVVLRYARTWIILHDVENFTGLKMRIYSDKKGEKGALLAESENSWSKADLISQAYGVKEIWFKFNYVPFNKDNFYHVALIGTPTNFSTTKHIAWVQAWPDPVYTEGLDSSFEKISISPYAIYYIGAEY